MFLTMAQLRAARLQLRLAQKLDLEGVSLEGRPARERIDQVADLLHAYTTQLRRQVDALANDS